MKTRRTGLLYDYCIGKVLHEVSETCQRSLPRSVRSTAESGMGISIATSPWRVCGLILTVMLTLRIPLGVVVGMRKVAVRLRLSQYCE